MRNCWGRHDLRALREADYGIYLRSIPSPLRALLPSITAPAGETASERYPRDFGLLGGIDPAPDYRQSRITRLALPRNCPASILSSGGNVGACSCLRPPP